MNSESNVTATSRGSYREHVISGKAKSQRQKILDFLETNSLPRNRREISLLLGIPINAVCGRVAALLENEDIRIAHVERDPQTNKRVEYLEFVHPEPKQVKMF